MDKKRLQNLCDRASQRINESRFGEALGIVNQMKNLGPNYLVSYMASALLIDIGTALKNIDIIEEGKQLLLKDFEKITSHAKYRSTVHYNLANAYLGIHNLEMRKNLNLAFFKASGLDSAKFHFMKALEYKSTDKILMAQIFVNLGNCYDNLGRVVDALECYDKALSLEPDFGMAIGNKGISLLTYADLCGEHQGTYVLEAYSLLKSAQNLGAYSEATSSFSNYIKYIEQRFSTKLPLQKSPKYPGYKIKAKSKIERFLIEFCLKYGLYLNVCSFCQKCDATIGDTVTIKTMILPARDTSYLTLSAYLNQIKQDYITARFLLILSRYENSNLDFVDKRVTIINTLDYNIHNIYIQLVKTSFKTFYDILDKIAFFINDYLRLGIPERHINFTNLWYTNKQKIIRNKIAYTKNLSLNALFDIHRDLDYGMYKHLKGTRNALTHRFVNVKNVPKFEDDKNMTEETLINRTLDLAKIVRNSIIYLLHFVYLEEKKKNIKTLKPTLPIPVHAIPDKMKSTRKKVKTKKKGKSD